MTGQTKLSSPYPENEQFGALILLIFVSGIAGICLGLLGGFKFPQFWKFPGYTLKPVIKGIVIPPLIAMLIMGCIVRNYFGEIVIPYPQPWTGWIRGFCLCILLCRGGLQVTFKGQGLTMVFMSFVPQVCEATVVAFLAKNLFDMPLTMGYVLGYNLACISPSILVPGLMSLNDRGYAKKNNLSGTLIAAGTFDDIICIICFGICKTILLSQAGFTEESMAMSIGLLFIGNVVALLIGITLGLCGWFLKYIKNAQTRIHMKLCYCIFGAISFVIIEEYAESHDCKYIAGLFFGYTLSRVWGEEKPTKHIAWFWFFIQPCLFGTVGGSLLFSQIRASDLGNGVIIIIIGVTVRFIVVVIVTHSPKYFFKDRLFMGITWIGKATVQAAQVLCFQLKQKNIQSMKNIKSTIIMPISNRQFQFFDCYLCNYWRYFTEFPRYRTITLRLDRINRYKTMRQKLNS
eukprot:403342411